MRRLALVVAPVILLVVLGVVGVAAAVNSPSGATPDPALLPGPAHGGAAPPEPRQPGAERVPALLERDRQHRPRAVGAARRARPHRDGRRRRPPTRRSAPTTPSTSAARSSEAGRRGAARFSRSARPRCSVPPDPQPLAHGRRGSLRGAQGRERDGADRRLAVRSRSALPRSRFTASRATPPTSKHTYGAAAAGDRERLQ